MATNIGDNVNQFDSSNNSIISKSGTASLLIVGIIILIIGLGLEFSNIQIPLFLFFIVGIIFIIFSFIFIIKQFERSIILRFGKFQKQIDPGIHARILRLRTSIPLYVFYLSS